MMGFGEVDGFELGRPVTGRRGYYRIDCGPVASRTYVRVRKGKHANDGKTKVSATIFLTEKHSADSFLQTDISFCGGLF